MEADFETAISATKFGKFNIFLYILGIPACWATIFETTTMAFVFPAAQCDLHLSFSQKGSLNAITYSGMVLTALLWGFLIDTLGRRKLLIAGYLADACIVLLMACSQDYIFLIIIKFFGGLVINGPFSAFATYVTEFHKTKYRARVLLGRGFLVSSGSLILPLMAWGILPRNIPFTVFSLKFHSWNVFLMLSALPSTISAIAFTFMPESPKFLMTTGRTEEALAVFRRVYKSNTGRDDFPITDLVDETKSEANTSGKYGGYVTANRNKKLALKEGCQQIRPICYPPNVRNVVLLCGMQAMAMFSTQTLRLWMPQIFQTINYYQHRNNGSASLCQMLGTLSPKNKGCDITFYKSLNESDVFKNSIIVALATITGYALATLIVIKVNKKILYGVCTVIVAICMMCMFLAQNLATVTALASIAVSLGQISSGLNVAMMVELVPTTLRAISISLLMMCGRLAALIGNALFPVFMTIGCTPTFVIIGSIMLCATSPLIFVPNTEHKPLQ